MNQLPDYLVNFRSAIARVAWFAGVGLVAWFIGVGLGCCMGAFGYVAFKIFACCFVYGSFLLSTEIYIGGESVNLCSVDDEHGAADAAAFDAAGQQVGAGLHRRDVSVRAVIWPRRIPRVDCSLLDQLIRLRCSIRRVNICRSVVYGKTCSLRAAAAISNLERHARHLQHRRRREDHPGADAYSEMARFWGVSMQVAGKCVSYVFLQGHAI